MGQKLKVVGYRSQKKIFRMIIIHSFDAQSSEFWAANENFLNL
jgi:hypothetical protein